MSLLTITSRHHQHQSHNSVTFHHAKAIQRQLPAPAHQHTNGKHGTRVTVRNLFGNLPVRVKQRAKIAADKTENDRLWDNVKTSVVALLLSCQKPVSLKARDAENHSVFTFNTTKPAPVTQTAEANRGKLRSAHLPRTLNLLTQAGYISITQWSYWVPISASTSSVSIKGTISLEPSPTRGVQFVSLGVQPVLAADRNELFEHVNRLFALSTFGTVEDFVDDDNEYGLPQSARQREGAACTVQQSKTRKGVDRYPMFHLRISCPDESTLMSRDGLSIDQDANLQAIVEVLDAMISQWLSVHHFRPTKTRTKRNHDEHLPATFPNPARHKTPTTDTRVGSGTESITPKKQQLSRDRHENLQHRAFAQWSRIKGSKASFFTDAMTLSKLESTQTRSETSAVHRGRDIGVIPCRIEPESAAGINLQPSAPDALSVSANNDVEHAQAPEPATIIGDSIDDTILWTDPLTRQTHSLNARTGCVIPLAKPRPATNHTSSIRDTVHTCRKEPLRLPPRTAPAANTPWLEDVLQTWENPIFDLNQKSIELLGPQDCCFQQRGQEAEYVRNDASDMRNFRNTQPLSRTRLSKEDLSHAQVLAQVDKKFILIRTRESGETNATHERPNALLVLIDQHAADERIRVEQLLEKLCSPVDTSCAYQSKLGHHAGVASIHLEKPLRFSILQQEKVHFISYAARFASWGILFDVSDSMTVSQSNSRLSELSCLLEVTALPPSVSERCKADTDLLISFLRSTVWHYANDPGILSRTSVNTSGVAPSWYERIATCPKGLLDMINSRACRSAIMFNDELDKNQCKEVVQTLATCVFPFVCAHGRPSMVPLIDISGMKGVAQIGNPVPEANKKTFVQSWKQWRE